MRLLPTALTVAALAGCALPGPTLWDEAQEVIGADELYVQMTYGEDTNLIFDTYVVRNEHGCISREQGLVVEDGTDTWYGRRAPIAGDGLFQLDGGNRTFGEPTAGLLRMLTPWGFCRLGPALDEVLVETADESLLVWDQQAFGQQVIAYREASRAWVEMAAIPSGSEDTSIPYDLIDGELDEFLEDLPGHYDGDATQQGIDTMELTVRDGVVTLEGMFVAEHEGDDDPGTLVTLRASQEPL